jgi:biotin carboxyl carrier protein
MPATIRWEQHMATKNLESTIAGAVLEIHVAAGDQVEDGDPVVTLECMKMEIPVAATTRGRISQVLVAVGDVLKEGQLVAVLET